MWVFLAGAGAMGSLLALIGITRNRWLNVRSWTAMWTGVSLALAVLMVVAVADGGSQVMEAVLGAALGYVASVSVHTLHHYLEEARRRPNAST